jgi:acetylglutamate kinase
VTGLSGTTFVVRVEDDDPSACFATFTEDLEFLTSRNVRPIIVAPSIDIARSFVRNVNRRTGMAVGLSGVDAAFLPATDPEHVGTIDIRILSTLADAGYVPVIEPTALDFRGQEIDIDPDAVTAAVAVAVGAARAFFFHKAGGVIDPTSSALITELTPSEALDLAECTELDPALRGAMRAAAQGVRAGIAAAQIIDGRIHHATIIEILTTQHLGTQVASGIIIARA